MSFSSVRSIRKSRWWRSISYFGGADEKGFQQRSESGSRDHAGDDLWVQRTDRPRKWRKSAMVSKMEGPIPIIAATGDRRQHSHGSRSPGPSGPCGYRSNCKQLCRATHQNKIHIVTPGGVIRKFAGHWESRGWGNSGSGNSGSGGAVPRQ